MNEHHERIDCRELILAAMSHELECYCERQGIDYLDTDELLLDDSITASQRAWLEEFRACWKVIAKRYNP